MGRHSFMSSALHARTFAKPHTHTHTLLPYIEINALSSPLCAQRLAAPKDSLRSNPTSSSAISDTDARAAQHSLVCGTKIKEAFLRALFFFPPLFAPRSTHSAKA